MIACYNEADDIAETLHSIALQDYPGELEVLVLDDGSTDGTAAATRAAIQEFGHLERVRMPDWGWPSTTSWPRWMVIHGCTGWPCSVPSNA